MRARFVDLRQRHAVQAEAGAASTAWRRFTGLLVPHLPVGLRLHRAEPREPRTTRSSASSAPAPPPCRSIPNLGGERQGAVRLPAHAVVDRHHATTGRPIPSGRRSCKPGWQAKRRAKAMTEPPLTRRCRSTKRRATSPRGEDPPPGERQHRLHDADPPPHRRDRRGPGDGRGAQALVHVHVQAAVLPQRLPADVQPPERPPRRHPRQGHHRDRPRRARSSTARSTRSTS